MTKPFFEVIPGGKDATAATIPSTKKLFAVVLSSEPYVFRSLPDGSSTQVPAFTAPELSDPTCPLFIYAESEDEAKDIFARFVVDDFIGETAQLLAEVIVLGEVTEARATPREEWIPGINDYELTIVSKVRVMGEQFVNDPVTGEMLD